MIVVGATEIMKQRTVMKHKGEVNYFGYDGQGRSMEESSEL